MHLIKTFDKDGHLASKGKPIEEEIKKIYNMKFLKKSPPKSLDRKEFRTYNELINKKYSVYDTMATLAEFTLKLLRPA